METYTEHQQQEYDYHPSEYENYDYQMDQAGNAMEGMQLVRLSLYAYFFSETFLFLILQFSLRQTRATKWIIIILTKLT